jgi:hypothetical protein
MKTKCKNCGYQATEDDMQAFPSSQRQSYQFSDTGASKQDYS